MAKLKQLKECKVSMCDHCLGNRRYLDNGIIVKPDPRHAGPVGRNLPENSTKREIARASVGYRPVRASLENYPGDVRTSWPRQKKSHTEAKVSRVEYGDVEDRVIWIYPDGSTVKSNRREVKSKERRKEQIRQNQLNILARGRALQKAKAVKKSLLSAQGWAQQLAVFARHLIVVTRAQKRQFQIGG